jgi:hypothetical protein
MKGTRAKGAPPEKSPGGDTRGKGSLSKEQAAASAQPEQLNRKKGKVQS